MRSVTGTMSKSKASDVDAMTGLLPVPSIEALNVTVLGTMPAVPQSEHDIEQCYESDDLF